MKFQSDGSFHAQALGSHVYYFLHGLSEGWYVKDFTVAGHRVSGTHFELPPGSNDLSMTLSPHGATVEFALPATRSILDAVYVLLLPQNGPVPDVETAIVAKPQQTGGLIAHSVPPGSYRVFALDATNWALAFDPKALMEKYGKTVPLIEIGEGEHKVLPLPLTKIKLE